MLPGMPEEYRPFLFVPKQADTKGLSEKMKEVLAADPEALREKAAGAQKFILQNKTSEKQIKKIIDFLGNEERSFCRF